MPFYSMILTVSSFAFLFVKNDLLTTEPFCAENELKCQLELAITCVHDYMVVTVKVTRSMEK